MHTCCREKKAKAVLTEGRLTACCFPVHVWHRSFCEAATLTIGLLLVGSSASCSLGSQAQATSCHRGSMLSRAAA